MGSRREEERNEKIIRGLLKLPPNRKCINCNSLGPQYVCTNFWTFVCITCSGIHREFTHRVKSVSMAKFTSQEVEALENGGNQRAREIYLKDWDMQRQRLPESSNIDKIREFIKNVYVDKKYAGGKSSDKPPRDTQNYKNHEEERRASSYHSYSQSPPYDYQYEDRRYGKQAGMLTRKPGSDRVQYDGKFSSLICSPGRTSGMEDRFANEGSAPRLSDFSVSSAGEASRHGGRSPNFQNDAGHSSPPAVPVRNILIEDGRRQTLNTFLEADAKGDSRNLGSASQSHRPASSESFGSFDGNSPGLRSVKSDSLIDVLERDQPTGIQSASSLSSANTIQASSSTAVGNQDFFGFSTASNQQPTSSAQSVDLFAKVNNYAPSAASSGQDPVTAPLSLSPDFSVEVNNSVVSTSLLAENPVTLPLIESEGWATFDMPQNSVFKSGRQTTPYSVPTSGGETQKPPFDAFFSESNELWASVKSNSAKAESIDLFSDTWGLASHQANTAPVLSPFQPWSAFDDNVKITQNPDGNSFAETNLHIPVQMSSVDSGIKVAEGHGKDFSGLAGGVVLGQIGNSAIPAFPLSANPAELAPPRKSTNPFDFACEPDLVNSSVLLDMNSLQAALPSTPFPTPLSNGAPWFAQFSVPSGSLQYMPAPSSQMPNLPPQGHVASLGGNPFA